jgi:exopolysaccharide biosynthesis polyprenyl glycosylphosphotransferase
MKKVQLLLTFLLAPLDYLMLVFAGVTAYFLRFHSFLAKMRPITFHLPFFEYLSIVIVMSGVWLIIFGLRDLYNPYVNRRLILEFKKITGCCFWGLTLVVFIFFLSRDLFESRFIVLTAWFLAIIYVFLGRLFFRFGKYFLYKKGIGTNNVILIGEDKIFKTILQELDGNKSLGYNVVGKFRLINDSNKKQFEDIIEKQKVDTIILADPNLPKEQSMRLIDLANEYHCVFKYSADLFETSVLNVEVQPLAGIPLVTLKRTRLDCWGQIFKRTIDILGSVIALTVFSPLIIVIAILIKKESKGPIIYKNKRVSRYGEFTAYKFRTMFLKYCTDESYDNSGAALKFEQELIKKQSLRKGPLYKIIDDPRRTKIGRFLEKYSLDEIPQFYNVLIGHMSLVGPRPHQLREVSRYEKRHKQLFEVKPGITGLAQISGRSDLNFEDEYLLDRYYIENWSLLLDFAIILKTPFIIFLKRHK